MSDSEYFDRRSVETVAEYASRMCHFVRVLSGKVSIEAETGPSQLWHASGPASSSGSLMAKPAWSGTQAYSESKFYLTALAKAVSGLRPDAFANAIDPGWVPTRMGGGSAPDNLAAGVATQVALASGAQGIAALSDGYLHHMVVRDSAAGTRNPEVQERLLGLLPGAIRRSAVVPCDIL